MEAALRLCSTCRLSCGAAVASSVHSLRVHSDQIRWCSKTLQVCAAVPFLRHVGTLCWWVCQKEKLLSCSHFDPANDCFGPHRWIGNNGKQRECDANLWFQSFKLTWLAKLMDVWLGCISPKVASLTFFASCPLFRGGPVPSYTKATTLPSFKLMRKTCVFATQQDPGYFFLWCGSRHADGI